MADIDTKQIVSAINNLGKVLVSNQGNDGSSKGRYSSGLMGYSDYFGDAKSLAELKEMIAYADKIAKSNKTLFGRFSSDLANERRNLAATRMDLEKSAKKFNETKKQLADTIGESSSEIPNLLEKAEKKLKDFKNEAEKNKKVWEETVESTGKNSDQIDKIISQYKELLKLKKEFKDKTEEEVELTDKDFENIGSTVEEARKLSEAYDNAHNSAEKVEKTEELMHKEASEHLEVLNKQSNAYDQIWSTVEGGFSKISAGGRKIIGIGKEFLDSWMKVDTATSNMVRNIGMSGKAMSALRVNTINTIKKTNWSDLYGVGMEDIISLQENYIKGSGRQIGMSNEDIEKSIGLSKIMGENGAQLASSLENFGLSYSASADLAGKMFKNASKYGLSFEKYSQNFLQNIKLAQNYTFKNGLAGLESMAKKATAIRLDMQQIASFAEKVGTLQGAVETSAQLQVLGGPFAQFSDPLGMLNESLTDMEGLMDRFQRIVGNLGKFNTITGQVDVGASNKQRIRAAAQAMGMDYGQVMESVQASGRRNYIESQIGNISGLSDIEKEFIKNTANVKNGKVMLSLVDKNGNRKEMTAAQAKSSGLLFEIMRQNSQESDDVRNIASDTRQMREQIIGVEKKREAIEAKVVEPIHTVVSKGISTVNQNLGLILAAIKTFGVISAGMSIYEGAGSLMNAGKAMTGVESAAGSASNGGNIIKTLKNAKRIKAIQEAAKAGSGAAAGGLKTIQQASKLKALKAAKKGGVTAALISGVLTGIDEFAGNKNYGTNKKIGRTAGSAAGAGLGTWGGGALGAKIGTLIAPGIGTAIGGAIGMIAGSIGGEALGKWSLGGFSSQKRREKKKAEFGLDLLQGDYSVKQLKAIASGNVSKSLEKDIKKKGDSEIFESIKQMKVGEMTSNVGTGIFNIQDISTESFTHGGIAKGNSEEGDKNLIRVNSGEMILNRKQQGNLFKMISTGFASITPLPMKMLSVLPSLINNRNFTSNVGGNGEGINSGPIDININGTIKLDAGNGVTKDIMDEMLKSPVFIRQITKLIEKQIITNNKGGNVVNKGLY